MSQFQLHDITPDINARLKDAGLVAADAAWQVGGSNKIVDLGDDVFTPFQVRVNVTAVEIASNDEIYHLLIQGSSSSTFASGIVNLAYLGLGALEVHLGNSTVDVDTTTGVYAIYGHNELNGTTYRYIRGYTDVAGTIATGINFDAWLTGLQVAG